MAEESGRFARKLAASLFDAAEEQEEFLGSLSKKTPTISAAVWLRPRPAELPFEILPPLPFQPDFVDLIAPDQKPGALESHQRGDFYLLDPSSVFSASVISGCAEAVGGGFTFDMCSAPGGKAITANRLLRPRLTVCNEVVGKRVGQLIANLQRCSIEPAAVFSIDSEILGGAIRAAADLVIVDAPCSGQSLLAKGETVPGCFHPRTVNHNANRQKRILGNSVRLAASGKFVAYMTCTFSREENEGVLEWLFRREPGIEPVSVPALESFRSHLANFPCYRLWPQQQMGAGAFAALLKINEVSDRQSEREIHPLRPRWKTGLTDEELSAALKFPVEPARTESLD